MSLTDEQLKLIPDRDDYREILTNNWKYSKFSVPVLEKDGYYYARYNSG